MFWNPLEKSWQKSPYMVKEYSVQEGHYLATVVVVPMGVRVENTFTRTHKDGWNLPGYSYFINFKTGLITETSAPVFHTDCCGNLAISGPFRRPEVKKPAKERHQASTEPSKHPLGKKLVYLTAIAKARYDEWREEQRAKAA